MQKATRRHPMLSAEDNDLLTRVGPGTPMGDLMRQYWLPALMSCELPAPNCPPLRVRLLGENLIAFRTTSGKVGLLAHACPHRGASLFYGRNEAEGIRRGPPLVTALLFADLSLARAQPIREARGRT